MTVGRKRRASRAEVTHVPVPRMDWTPIREAKIRCKDRCERWSEAIGACRLALLPNAHCRSYRFRMPEMDDTVDREIIDGMFGDYRLTRRVK